MLVSFNPFVLLFWAFVSCFLPGAILSFGLFRGSRFNALEKALIGFGLGIVLVPLVPFLLFFIAGIKFSYAIALFSVALFYVAALAALVLSRAHEDLKLPRLESGITLSLSMVSSGLVLSLILLIIVIFAFLARLSTYSPVFMELDPYYYTYITQQVLVDGGNFQNDTTAWYPDLTVNHREVPEVSYLEATWYSLYTQGGAYDNMLLAALASTYPPIVAALAVFFVYIFVSAYYKKEWAILAAGLAAFIPVFMMKTLGGEMETQPYAFFSIAFFIAMYVSMLKGKDVRFALLSALAFVAVTLGSGSDLIVVTVLLLFVPLQSVFIFLAAREDNREQLRTMLVNNAIILVLGVFLFSGLIKGLFYYGQLSLTNTVAIGMAVAICAALYAIRAYVPEAKKARNLFIAMVLAGIFLFFLTPVGGVIKGIGATGLGVAQFNFPLQRTIAEQNVAGSDFSGEFGFIAAAYPSVLQGVMGVITSIVNLSIDLAFRILDWLLETNLQYDAKANSMLMLWLFLFGAALVYSAYRLYKGEDTPVLLFAALVIPPVLIGLLKAKYTIYAGFLLAAAIGFTFGESEEAITRFLARTAKNEEEKKEYLSYAYYALIVIAGLLLVLQFSASSNGMARALVMSSFTPRFQDDPGALKVKFQSICDELKSKNVSEDSICSQYSSSGLGFCTAYDSPICTVAADPVAYASQGTNSQYNRKLCYYSLISDIMNPKSDELLAASLRCQRISEYWIESMEWLRYNTENGSRTISWWDYGHWINFFGQKNAVIRNEHLSPYMIGEVAHDYIDGTPEDLAQFMRSHNSTYALFDMELIAGGNPFGGKYGALNYLSCARDNETNVSLQPGMSQCEADHLWEMMYIPKDSTDRTCQISKSGNKTGVIGYEAYWTWDRAVQPLLSVTYPNIMGFNCYGDYLNDPTTLAVCQNLVMLRPTYCVGQVLLADGQQSYGTYLLNETYSNGDLKLNKAQLISPTSYTQTYHLGDAYGVALIYNEDPVFLENGQAVSGYDDRRTKFYSSNLYRALFVGDLPGFTLAFQTKDGQVRIYRLNPQ
jgi:asparagine N-glycosylation enzyme membrane subunit Stt3